MGAEDGYERRIGRYGLELAAGLLAVAGARPGMRAADVGCGAGALTGPLAAVVGAANVDALDVSPEAVAACARRVPGARVVVGHAERLPWWDATFDLVVAQLLIGLVEDPPAVAGEMHRVARPGAAVATCVWDFAGGMTMLRAFWDAAHAVAPTRAEEFDQARTHAFSTRAGLEGLWRDAGLRDVESGELIVGAGYRDFDDLWDPLAVPDGSPGRFLAGLGAGERSRVRDDLFERLGKPPGAFRLTARAWYALGRGAGRH